MKKTLLFLTVLFLTSFVNAQEKVHYPDGTSIVRDKDGGWRFIETPAPTYKYYFLMLRATGKAEVEVSAELGVSYSDIDKLIVAERRPGRKGEEIVNRRYESYSDAFNALSGAGLEFVQFASLPTIGGGAQFLAGDIRFNYSIWRKKITD